MLPHGRGPSNLRNHRRRRHRRVACGRGGGAACHSGRSEGKVDEHDRRRHPTLVLIGLAAVLAPIVAEWSRRFVAVPEVVIQILFGIILGPYVLNLAHPTAS